MRSNREHTFRKALLEAANRVVSFHRSPIYPTHKQVEHANESWFHVRGAALTRVGTLQACTP